MPAPPYFYLEVADSSPDKVIGYFFNLPNPSSHTMTLGSTQPLTEMNTRYILEGKGKGRPARKAENLAASYEQIV
jgi:hypothetical protein